MATPVLPEALSGQQLVNVFLADTPPPVRIIFIEQLSALIGNAVHRKIIWESGFNLARAQPAAGKIAEDGGEGGHHHMPLANHAPAPARCVIAPVGELRRIAQQREDPIMTEQAGQGTAGDITAADDQ